MCVLVYRRKISSCVKRMRCQKQCYIKREKKNSDSCISYIISTRGGVEHTSYNYHQWTYPEAIFAFKNVSFSSIFYSRDTTHLIPAIQITGTIYYTNKQLSYVRILILNGNIYFLLKKCFHQICTTIDRLYKKIVVAVQYYHFYAQFMPSIQHHLKPHQ